MQRAEAANAGHLDVEEHDVRLHADQRGRPLQLITGDTPACR